MPVQAVKLDEISGRPDNTNNCCYGGGSKPDTLEFLVEGSSMNPN